MRAKTLRRLVRGGLLATVSAFALLCLGLTAYGLVDTREPADVALVFGNKVETTGAPSPALRARLEAAAEVYARGVAPVLIVSGGLGKEGFDEAQVMKQYLLERGIPESAVRTDSAGSTTWQSAANFAAESDPTWCRVIVVSQYFHLARCVLALRKFGDWRVGHYHARLFAVRDLYSVPREAVALPVYAFRKPAQPRVPTNPDPARAR